MSTTKKNIQTFYINSEFCEKLGTSSFQQKIQINKKVNHVEIVQTSIPKSYYIINATNNVFTIYWADSSDQDFEYYSFVLTPGNYSRTQLETALQNGINSQLSVQGISCIVNHETAFENGKIRFIFSGISLTQSVQFQFLEGSPYKILNAEKYVPNSIKYIFTSGNTTQDFGPINLQDSGFLYLTCDKIVGSHNITSSGYQLNNVLYSYSMQNVPQFDFLYHQSSYFDHKKLNRIYENEYLEFDIKFINENLQQVDLQNIPFSISVQFFYSVHSDQAVVKELHVLQQRIAILTQYLFKRFYQNSDAVFMQQLLREEAAATLLSQQNQIHFEN